MLPKVLGFVSMILLLVWLGYSIMGSLPLLILRHDTPVDARFIRNFFEVQYRVAAAIAGIGAVGFGLSGQYPIAVAMAVIASIGLLARRTIVSTMDRLRETMTLDNAPTIRKFRQLHVGSTALNAILMAGFVWTIAYSSLDLVSCIDLPRGCGNAAESEGPCRHECSLMRSG